MFEMQFTPRDMSAYHAFLAKKKKQKPSYIYALIDPDTDEVRYIGKSINPRQRLSGHMNDKSFCHRAHWLQGLKAKGKKPLVLILDRAAEGEDWQFAERCWISLGRELKWPLTNNTSGGDGVVDLAPESRERIRKAWIGRKHSPESLIRIGDASRGRVKSEASKELMRRKMSGREIKWTDKVSAALAKLSPKDQQDILDALSRGEMVKDLAEKYGVHRTTISKVKAGQYAPKSKGAAS